MFKWIMLISAFIVGSLGAQTFPTVTGKDLGGEPLSVPLDLSGRASVIIVGFTRGSAEACQSWHKGLLGAPSAAYRIVSLVDLEGAPFFVPGLVRQSMKKTLPKVVWGDAVLLREGTVSLKQALHFDPKAADQAYGAVLDANGAVRGLFGGVWSPGRRTEIEALLPRVIGGRP